VTYLPPTVADPRLRKRISGIGFYLVAVLAAYVLAVSIMSDKATSLGFLSLIIIDGAIVVAILNNWRQGVSFFLIWLLFEDLARKFLSNNMVIYFAKDFLVLVVLVSFYTAYRRKALQSFRPPFLVPLLVFVFLVSFRCLTLPRHT